MKEQNYLDHLVGVFGQPVAENPGVVIQDAAFQAMGLERWHFLTLDVDKDKLGDAIQGLKAFKMRGINCTIPHKIAVMDYLDEISHSAKLIGAVNMIVNDNGHLFGENTDGKGFMMSLESNGIDVKGKKVVVFGAGGAARAICVEMGLAGAADITIVNRAQDRALGDALMEILRKKREEENVSLSFTRAFEDDMVENGYDPVYGARPVKRLIQRELVNRLAREILEGKIRKDSKIVVDCVDGQTVLRNE